MDFTDLQYRRNEHQLGGGKDKQEEQRRKKKLTVFERLDAVFDAGTFVELDQFIVHDSHEFGMDKKKTIQAYGKRIRTICRATEKRVQFNSQILEPYEKLFPRSRTKDRIDLQLTPTSI